MQEMMREKARELLSSGKVDRVLGWKEGDFVYDVTPHVFTAEDVDELIYHSFASANLSKYLIGEAKKDGVTAVFLKPCDSYSFVQLLKEHRVPREKVYAISIPCLGKVDADDLRAMDIRGITKVSVKQSTITASERLISERILRFKNLKVLLIFISLIR